MSLDKLARLFLFWPIIGMTALRGLHHFSVLGADVARDLEEEMVCARTRCCRSARLGIIIIEF